MMTIGLRLFAMPTARLAFGLVFHGFVFMYRSVINISGIWLVLSLGFTPALVVLIAAFGVLLFLSLIILAGQHS